MNLAIVIAFSLGTLPAFAAEQNLQQATSVSTANHAQESQPDTESGLKEALLATELRKDDAETWLRLGIAYNKVGKNQEARNAFQRALKLRSKYPEARAGLAYTFFVEGKLADAETEAKRAHNSNTQAENFTTHRVLSAIRLHRYRAEFSQVLQAAEAALKINSNDANAHFAKSQAIIGLMLPEPQLSPDFLQSFSPPTHIKEAERIALRAVSASKYKEAANSLERYLQLQPNAANAAYLRERLPTIRFYAQEVAAPENERIAPPTSELTKRISIFHKPEPGYTTKARRKGVSGIVSLRLLFASDGTVKHILPLNDLGYGLTEKAVQAARQIRFEPAMKDGRVVSQFAIINYSFEIY